MISLDTPAPSSMLIPSPEAAAYAARAKRRPSPIRALLRAELAGQTRTICKGRSSHTAGYHSNVPVVVLPDDSAPRLDGLPYLKTTFRNGPRFARTLYTPSTLRATVGAQWLAARGVSL